MELNFESVELAAFSDKPVGAYYPMNDINWVYESMAKREATFEGFYFLGMELYHNEENEVIPELKDYGCSCSIRSLRADVRDDLLILYGDLKFTIPDEAQNIKELLSEKPWRIIIGKSDRKYDEVTKKYLEKNWVSMYFVEQIDEKDFLE